MSKLDELKKKAQQKQAGNSQDLSDTLQRNELNWHKIAPKLFEIKDYFKDLAETLNVVEPESFSTFNVTQNFALKRLQKRNFRISEEKDSDGRSFSFRYDLVGQHNQKAAVNNEAMVVKLRSILTAQRIKFTEQPESKTRIIFMIKPQVATSFTYEADVMTGMINLTITNYDGIMTQTIRYKPEAINPDLLDETVKFLLAEDNNFMEMSGYTMSEDLRKKLQERLKSGDKKKDEKEEPHDLLESTVHKFSSIFKK